MVMIIKMNKLLIFFFAVFAVTQSKKQEKAKLTQEFLQGFDTGLLVRQDELAFKDYSCPEVDSADANIGRLMQYIGPLKMVSEFVQSESLKNLSSTIEMFLVSMRDFMGVFNHEYDGGDFCKGLIFGRDGANMLYQVAGTLVSDEEKQMFES